MGEPAHTRFELRACEFAAIDAEAGVISGVSVIAVGPAKGHGLQIDSKTLEQVKACAETYSHGLKVKMTHAGDAGDIAGFLSAFRIEGDKLLADLTLLKSSPFRAYVLELAATIPDTFGLSIAFSGPVETQGKTRLARCSEIYSADLVSEPAANPTGLFEAKPATDASDKPAQTHQPTTTMDETKMAALQASLDALSARLEKIEKATPAPAETPEQLQAKYTQVAELAAKSALTQFAATLGTAPGAASAPAPTPKPDDKPKTFEQLVKEHPEYAKNKKFAITDTRAKHPKELAEYDARLKAGEVILF